MQHKTSNSILIFIHGFILFIAFLFVVKGIMIITDIWQTPNEIAIPINFSIEEAGKIKYQKNSLYNFRISNATGTIRYYPQNLEQAPIPIYNIFIRLLGALLPMFVFFLLHKIMQTAIRKTPFDLINVKRMRWIGIGLIILGLLTVIKKYNGLDFLTDYVTSDVISFYTVNTISSYVSGTLVGAFFRSELILGLVALFGAEILKYGILLKEENALTI